MPAKKKTPKKRTPRPVRRIHRFKVALMGIEPPVRRVIELPSDCTLGDLHMVLQAAFGWQNYHLHVFEVGGRSFGMPDPETGWEDEDAVDLSQVAREKGVVLDYEYDLGDCWAHRLLLEKIGPPEKGVSYPRCVAGARACPPEDCGGTSGYERLLEALADPANEEHAELIEWIGEKGFDPEAFDVDAVNEVLRSF